jgi:hypothetical protein
MNKPTFTKGPWHAFEQNGSNPKTKGLFAITAPHESGSQQTVAVTPFAGDGNELWANARLIAAAPELFEALKAIYEIDVPDAEWSPTLEKCFGVALDAIAKVEGEK